MYPAHRDYFFPPGPVAHTEKAQALKRACESNVIQNLAKVYVEFSDRDEKAHLINVQPNSPSP
jgi:hypothetical protein